MAKQMKLILLGAPGAGKGTQAEIISDKWEIPAISTGAIIREAIQSGTALGRDAKSYIEKGDLVPDAVVIGIIQERLAQKDCENGFILDGFPRTVVQAKALKDMGVEITNVVSIEVPDEKILKRMTGRRVCKKCGATYHTEFKPSPDGENCTCGEVLGIRSDDEPAIVASRLETYHNLTEPLKDFYGDMGILKLVYGQEKIEDTTALVAKALES